jgi:hypothetical protein
MGTRIAWRTLLGAAAVAVASGCVTHPPPASDVLRRMSQEGYTPNPGLSGLVQPGNIIQTMELGPDGLARPLSPPLVLAWGTDCFPGLKPREGPFALAAESGGRTAEMAFEGPEAMRLLPSINVGASATSGQKMRMKKPRVRAFARGDMSGKLSQKCVEVLRQAFAEGDRPEWFSVVIEALVVDGFVLELTWNAGVGLEVRERVTQATTQAVEAVAADEDPFGEEGAEATESPAASRPAPRPARVKIGFADAKQTLIELAGTATVAYRTRTLAATYGALPGAAAPARPPGGASLRDAFDGRASAGRVAVGRLAVRLLAEGRSRRVRVDHPFRSGDAFQLEVAADRPGWLFVLHAESGGSPKLLWPRPGARPGEWLDDNAVRAREAMVVPPSPGSFRMDERPGEELFWVALSADRRAPSMGQVVGAVPPSGGGRPAYLAGPAPTGPIVQFAVRGGAGQPLRGVLFDPGAAGGAAEPDPAIYFSAAAEDPGADSVLEFWLRHGR